MLFWTFQFKVVGLPCLQEICRDIWGGMIEQVTTGEGNLNGDWVMQLFVPPQEVATRVQSKTRDLVDGGQR